MMTSHKTVARQNFEEQNFHYQNLSRKESATRRNFTECIGCVQVADAISMGHGKKISKAAAVAIMKQYRDKKMAYKVKITVDTCFGLMIVRMDIKN